ncbi:hypothetical protein MPRS_21000 [Mycobacterium paraseoulense]|nr:hypothetical protein MPRS_21000 [Mycobacterium paraseoulense]
MQHAHADASRAARYALPSTRKGPTLPRDMNMTCQLTDLQLSRAGDVGGEIDRRGLEDDVLRSDVQRGIREASSVLSSGSTQ